MIKIYTDGACKGNPGVGGWGALILKDEKNIELFGGERETTNNRMELMAVIMALKEISSSTELTIYTDSTYVQKGISEWIKNWKMNNWRSSSKKPVKNKDLWIELDEASASRKINWEWVKGHAGNEGNEKADELANKGVISMMGRI
jgi:ribonuclease HI